MVGQWAIGPIRDLSPELRDRLIGQVIARLQYADGVVAPGSSEGGCDGRQEMPVLWLECGCVSGVWAGLSAWTGRSVCR